MSRHLRALLALVGIALSVAFPLPAAAEAFRSCAPGAVVPEAAERALDSVLTGFLARPDETGGGTGAVLLVRRPGWTYHKAAGVADPDTGTPLDCASPYEIGSATKMMTGAVLLQLQEEGRLSLHDRLSIHLPAIARLLPFGDRITLFNLATHTSGLFNYAANAPDGALGLIEGGLHDPAMLVARRTPQEMVDFVVAHGRSSFAPGAQGQWAYSNTGYILLGMVIERIEGAPLDQVFQRRLFEPLALRDTFLWNDAPVPAFGLPRAWFRYPDGPETTGWNLSQSWAAGGVIATASDLADFLESLLSGAPFVAGAETLAEMQTTVPARPPIMEYGVGLIAMPHGAWGHGGQTMGFQSDAGRVPSTGTTVIAWANAADGPVASGVQQVLEVLAALPAGNR